MSGDRVTVFTPNVPPICEREVLRYMGAKDATDAVTALLRECMEEAKSCFTYRVCWRTFEVRTDDTAIDLGFAQCESAALRRNLVGCKEIVLFAATVGIGIDRLITRYSRLSPSRALVFQALGAERIEALCDAFNDQVKEEYQKQGNTLRPRFSPGYGDLPLSLQRDIFRVLDCPKQIGLTLNESCLMSPSKSVTALIGVY